MRSLLLLLVVTSTRSEESAQYLQNAVRDLRQLNVQSLRRADVAMVSSHASHPEQNKQSYGRRYGNEDQVPPLTLTKGELAALYESAVKKGETLKLDAGDDTYVHAAVHEIDDDKPVRHHSEQTNDDTSGYYYYYYPIKSFLDQMLGEQTSSTHDYSYKHKPKPPFVGTTKRPPYQFHSHHHEHDITISNNDKKTSKLEPLFMAISGFIGMAVMFVFSAIIMPKLSKNPKKRVLNKKDENDDFEDFARLALKAIEGECAERFACELSKTARNFNFQDNRFIKLLKRIAPGTFGSHIDKVGHFTNKFMKCTAIPCKKKNNNNNNNNNNKNKKPQRNQKKNPAQKRH